MAVASLVLGILSIILSFTGFGFLFGIIGLILAILARRQLNAENRGLATGGLVTSLVGMFLPLIFVFTCLAGATGASFCAHKAMQQMDIQNYPGAPADQDQDFKKQMEEAIRRGQQEMKKKDGLDKKSGP
jgi:hypothetical protein